MRTQKPDSNDLSMHTSPEHKPDKKKTKARKAKKARRQIKKGPILLGTIVLCIGALSLLIVSILRIGAGQPGTSLKTEVSTEENVDPTRKNQPPATFTFVGVGDNILHDAIYVYYEMFNGNRDYLPIFEGTLPYTKNADLAYINLETICAGDEYGLSGDPAYNGPLEMLNVLQSAGFDWMSLASDHSLDIGEAALKNEINYLNVTFPQIATTGAFQTLESADKPVVRDVNGIKVAMMSFTYDTGRGKRPNGQDWLLDVYRNEDGSINYDLMKKRVDAAKKESDVQLVSIQWGNENSSEVTKEQRTIARFLNEQGVDVILGTNPRVIQPVEFITNGDHKTLCYYSLGTFLSALDTRENMVGGMASFALTYNFSNGDVTFKDVKFIPTITYMTPGLDTFRTLTINEYTDEMAANQYIARLGVDTSRAWVNEYVKSIMGSPEGIEIVYGG